MVCCWMLAPLHNYNRPTTQPPFSISTQPIATHNISISLPSCLFVSFLSICLFVNQSASYIHLTPYFSLSNVSFVPACSCLMRRSVSWMVAVIGDNFINQPGCSLAADKGWGWSETSLQSPPTHRQLFGLRTNLHQIVYYQLKWKKPTLSFLCPTVSHVFSTIWRQIIIKQQCCCVSQPHRVVVCIVW